jgi:S1-C subfamily serine protease
MRTIARMSPLAVLLLLPVWSGGEERPRLADVQALQEAVHQAIQRAEPSIACILVSRSQKYREYERSRNYDDARPEEAGKLGRFDVQGALRGRPRTDPEHQAIVNLDLSDPDNAPESFGSGVVIDDKERLVLTPAHVVRKATKIYVRLPGRRGSWADIHALDPRSDLAVLRLLDRVPNLKALPLGDGGKLRKGDFVLSLSNPFAAGFRDGSPSASWGMVSNLRRRPTGMLSEVERGERARLPLYRFGTLIQTDTRMNLGCSGGALLNLQGELVGLTTSLAGIIGGETPGGFAVPLDAGTRRIIDVLRRGEEVEYGFLGVYLKGPKSVPAGYVQIDRPIHGGPAENASLRDRPWPLRAGDFILSINGTPIHDTDELFLAIGMHLAGSTVRIEAASPSSDDQRRHGTSRTHTVRLAKYAVPDSIIASNRPPARGGLRVDWTSTRPLDWAGIPKGVVIREVLPKSAADKAGLQPNIVITRVNDKEVTEPAEFYRAMERADGPVKLTYLNATGGTQDITIDSK